MKEKKKMTRWQRILRMAVILLLLAAAVFLVLEKNLETVILNLAHARAEAIAVAYINEAAQSVLKEGVSVDG